MKRFLYLTAMIIATLSMTACGEEKNNDATNNGNSAATTATLEIDAQYTDLGGLETLTNESDETATVTTETTTVEATEEATEALSDSDGGSSGGNNSGDYKAVENIEKDDNGDIIFDNLRLVPVPDAEPTHPDINFGLVTYDENEFDVFECDVETFETLVNRASCTSALKHNTDDFYFYGVPFITRECYLELITPQNTVTRCNTTSKDVLYPCDIKGIAVEGDASLAFYNGIRIGTPETTVKEALGDGITGCTFIDTKDYDREKRTVIYKSETTTMVIIYIDEKNIAGESVGMVDKIFVLQND